MVVYFVFVLGIGVALKRYVKTSTDFFLGRPLDSRLGRGLGVYLGQSGRAGSHRHGRLGRQVWHRDQPFLLDRRHPRDGVRRHLHDAVLLRLAARSVPEYLRLRFDEKTRGLNAISFAVMTVFSSGISMYAMAKLIQILHIFDAPFRMLGLPQRLDLPFLASWFRR